ncbi:reactive intermediate/imine deaminase [Spirochaetia bacterium]|nr:reactive intermediate/imine deaminase [Spirochaetia bacterium]
MLTKIETSNAPGAIGPYSQAIDTGNMLFISGQLGINPATGELPEGFEEQAKNVMTNLKAILEEAGYGFDRVVKATIFLEDLANFTKTNEIYGASFPTHKPARSCIQVAALPRGGKIEIELIAVK